jgi:hypothetical protein
VSRASEAFKRLTDAMLTTDPACQNDKRFVLDDEPTESLAGICHACPLLALCTEYAEIERPKGGVWAGKRYRTYKSTNEEN